MELTGVTGVKRSGDFEDEGTPKKPKVLADIDPGRAIYIGNVPPETTYYDICCIASPYGSIEFIKLVPTKGCAFINFVEEAAAKNFFDTVQQQKVKLLDREIKMGWAKSSPLSEDLKVEIDNHGATRNLFLGSVSPQVTELQLRQIFSRFGEIENVVMMPQKSICFVNMTSIKAAIAAVSEMNGKELQGRTLKVAYAKEGIYKKGGSKNTVIAAPPQQQMAFMNMLRSMVHLKSASGREKLARYMMTGVSSLSSTGSRSVYVGNLPETINYHDLCLLGNKFGALESVTVVAEKKCAFLNFIEPFAAQELYQIANQQAMSLKGQPIRVGWAKSAPIPFDIMEQIHKGATRSIYLGNLTEQVTEEDLKALFEPFCGGKFDSVVIFPQKHCGFVNLLSVKEAITAINGLQKLELNGQPIRVNYAKEG